VRSAEVAGDVAALLVLANDAEGADFLEGGAEILVDELADLRIGQGVHTERLSVVSGQARVFENSRNVQDEDQLFILVGLLRRLGRSVVEMYLCAVGLTAAGNGLLRLAVRMNC